MAATVNIIAAKGGTSGSPNYTSALTQFKFRSDDNPDNTDNTNPILKPSSGQNYSYWVHLLLNISGSFTSVANIKAYSDGTLSWSMGTNGDFILGRKSSSPYGLAASDYVPATGTEGTTGNQLNATNHTGIDTTESFFTYTSSNKLLVDDNTYTSAAKSKMIVLQLVVDNDATAGSYSGENITFEWDEVP